MPANTTWDNYSNIQWPGSSSGAASNWTTNSAPALARAAQENARYQAAFAAQQAAINRNNLITGGSSSAVSPSSTASVIPYGDLASVLNAFMTDQARMPFETNLPGYTENVAQRGQNTGALLRGEVPEDVRNQIIQSGAERGIATGSPGSPNSNAAWLRALGLTSLGLQQQGSQNLSQSIADTPVSPLWNPASLFVPQTLAQDEFNAARAGLGTGGGLTRGGGGGGTHITGMPNLTPSTGPFSWLGPQGPAVGGTGPFDEYQPYSGGTWAGAGGSQYYNLPTGDTYGGGAGGGPYASNYSNFNDPYDPGFWASDNNQPLNYTPGQGGITDWSDYGNIDWSVYE